VAVVATALAYQAAGHNASVLELVYLAVTFGPVGFIEELLFRGFIWGRCREAGLGPTLVVAVNAITFALWHVPAVLSDHDGLTELAWDAGLGLVLSLVRLWSANTTLGGLLMRPPISPVYLEPGAPQGSTPWEDVWMEPLSGKHSRLDVAVVNGLRAIQSIPAGQRVAQSGGSAVPPAPAPANAARTSATLGKVSRTGAVSGQNRVRPMCWQRPANAERIRIGAPGHSTRASSRAAAGRSASNAQTFRPTCASQPDDRINLNGGPA
jgi:Type II CAAX prenyl endopeptidase Rce1-like